MNTPTPAPTALEVGFDWLDFSRRLQAQQAAARQEVADRLAREAAAYAESRKDVVYVPMTDAEYIELDMAMHRDKENHGYQMRHEAKGMRLQRRFGGFQP